MNRARKLVEMVVLDSDRVTTQNEMCEEDLKLLESVNSIDEHHHENWAVDENGKEVDLNVYHDNSTTVTTTINDFNNTNNYFDDYEFVMTDNINNFVNINAETPETEKNDNADDFIKEINVDCDDVSEYMSVNSIKIGRTSKENASIKRVAGDPYMGSKVENGKCVQSCPKPGRYLKDCCVHNNKKNKLGSKGFFCGMFTEVDRKIIFRKFWKLGSWKEKKAYINGLVITRAIVRRRKSTKINNDTSAKKNYARDIYLSLSDGQKYKVCRTFFLNTLCIGEDTFKRWTKHDIETSSKSSETIMDNHNSILMCESATKKTSPRTNKKIQDTELVVTWLNMLPKVPSHYCRKSTNRIYVESTFLSVSEMYKEFSRWVKEELSKEVPRDTLFRRVLKNENIYIHKPRKDQCDICTGHKTKIDAVDEITYQNHIQRKDNTRTEKNKKKIEASDKNIVVTMDLESVLLCPNTLASSMFYKQKLQVHNFTIYNLGDKPVTLYVWHEANGGVTANEFISCIVDFIMNLNQDVEQVTLISDGCNYQNRNKSLASALRLLSKEKNVDIEQLFLCKGHTMMEVDSVHSTLEHYFKPPLYSPSDYITRMRMARPSQPYNIKVLDYSFFKNYDAMCDITSLRPGKKTGDKVVTYLCQLKYSPSSQNIQYKTNTNDNWENLPITTKNQVTTYTKSTRSKTAATTIEENVQIKLLSDVPNLYSAPLPITKAKYDDLQSLKKVLQYNIYVHNLILMLILVATI